MNPIQPNTKQIKSCTLSGWEYLGDGLFVKQIDGEEMVGYFTETGWVREFSRLGVEDNT